MPNVFLYSALVGAVLVASGTVYLVYLNWGDEKLTGTLISLLLGAIVTTFVAVLSVLKSSTIESTFTSSVIFDQDERLPLLYRSDLGSSNAALRLWDLSRFGRPKVRKGPAGALELSIERPLDENAAFAFGCELLQYKVICDIRDKNRPGQTITSTVIGVGGIQTTKAYTPPKLTRVTSLSPEICFQVVSKNRFSNSESEKEAWMKGLILPEGTALKLVYLPESKKSGSEKRSVILEKPRFFKITITIEPTMSSTHALGIEMSPEQSARCKTYLYLVKMVASFDRLTAGNWQTAEYRKWVDWLFGELRESLAN